MNVKSPPYKDKMATKRILETNHASDWSIFDQESNYKSRIVSELLYTKSVKSTIKRHSLCTINNIH